ncbi:MAG: glycosyltransferase family 2 protein [Prosthecobacter sp.]|uniref:glycosyltransferase family 2 protein n=1 Tax=Prosthecobacter sp. TaxID=1965333 RepID=UPI003903F786
MPCCNAERWIGQCIESALAQTWAEKEVVVVDDGSTDGSLAIILSFDDRIRFETGPNCGGNAARNRLLELSRGDWLQYLDADDYLKPDKIEKQMRFIETNPETDVVFSRVIQETHHEGGEVRQGVSLMLEPLDPWCLLVRWDLPQTGALLWRRTAIVSAGAWKVDQPCCQEHELYLRALKAGHRFAYCTDYGAVYRQWSTGSVCTKNPSEVHRRRLEIIGDAEGFLREQKELTPPRLWAISHARLEVARQVWRYDTALAVEIDHTIHRSQPDFEPGGQGRRISYGAGYRLGYRLLGFKAAEKLAGWQRGAKKS